MTDNTDEFDLHTCFKCSAVLHASACCTLLTFLKIYSIKTDIFYRTKPKDAVPLYQCRS
uniref:Uncharacterized protein n=1 Tax=Rhizophora mucronata TaxID=61149 RepID=A0A2P2PPH6_RHIMU